MKFKVNRDFLSIGLSQVSNIVTSKVSLSILSNVLLKTESESLLLVTKSLDLSIQCRIKANIEKIGLIALPVKKLISLIRSLPEKIIEFEVIANQVHIKAGKSYFKITGIDGINFPLVELSETYNHITMLQEDLSEMIKKVYYAQSTDENRYILNGIYWNFQNQQLTLVATDGRRLSLISKKVILNSNIEGIFILPAKTANELMRLLGKGKIISISFNKIEIIFQIATDTQKIKFGAFISHIQIVSKIIEGNYPNYLQVIPKELFHKIKINRALFLDSLHRVSLVKSDKNNYIQLSVDSNYISIICESVENGTAKESFEVIYDGPIIKIAFNPQFIIDVLKSIDEEEISFELKDHFSPGVLRGSDNLICVIMPLRLEEL